MNNANKRGLIEDTTLHRNYEWEASGESPTDAPPPSHPPSPPLELTSVVYSRRDILINIARVYTFFFL